MGLTDIRNVFANTRAQGRPALMPYWPLGYPDTETSLRIIEAIVRAGADMLELGVPFSDPLADGPVIQRASQIALEHGASMLSCISATTHLRARGVSVPVLAMGYLNPLLAYGEANYVRDWHAAGADGFIIPDLPPEESGVIAALCAQDDMALVQFTAPNSTQKRIDLACDHATGFIYVVAVTGVTGARESVALELRANVERVRASAGDKPIVVGFVVSKPDHVREIGHYADGVIVASALIRAVSESTSLEQTAYDFVRQLRDSG
jgi:tryptophan synthase alpha chain